MTLTNVSSVVKNTPEPVVPGAGRPVFHSSFLNSTSGQTTASFKKWMTAPASLRSALKFLDLVGDSLDPRHQVLFESASNSSIRTRPPGQSHEPVDGLVGEGVVVDADLGGDLVPALHGRGHHIGHDVPDGGQRARGPRSRRNSSGISGVSNRWGSHWPS